MSAVGRLPPHAGRPTPAAQNRPGGIDPFLTSATGGSTVCRLMEQVVENPLRRNIL
jgi:hypothetical protein